MTPSNMLRVVRRGKFRYILITGIGLTLMVVLYQGFSGNIKSVSVPSFGNNDFKRENNNSPNNNNLDQSDAPQVNKPGLSALLWGWSAGKGSTRPTDECRLIPKLKDVDIDTVEVYPTLNFKPSYKTYWNHTFEKRFLKQRETWEKLPLRVFVLPHSHNDPGWLKTFDGYFLSSTAYILNNMVNRLEKYRNMTFIWSEISFFAKWWDSLKNRPELREVVRQQVHRGQLEMVTGGWVMTDEAAAHYHAMVEQLVEGHQWLKTHLGVVPKNGWSIDPFGHSSTVPYLLRESGIDNMIIQRIHFAWKQYLAERKRLEFVWKQYFDKPSSGVDGRSNGKDVLCHMTPFDLYSIKHTCGPDTDVCLQFDFRRIAGEYSESTAVQINDENIEQKSKLLLGQYGRIGSLFPHNVALVFLGDDFRFNHDVEWDQQYSNYQKIFDHINGQKHLNAKLSFGTLDDYFKEVHARMEKLKPETFATLAGDFLPYGDIYAEARPSYWTGYFTTRPYWKHLTRELEHWLRSAEILYSLCRTLTKQRGNEKLLERLNQDYLYLTTARESLGLFQHHDAITGTSKADVMNDYGKRLYRGIRESIGVISHSAQYVMLKEPIKTDADLRPAHPMTSYLFPDINRPSYDSFPQKVAFSIPRIEGRKIVVFNSALHRRQQVIRMMVKTPHVKVLDANNVELPSQVNPAWNGTIEIISGIYELNFVIEMPPLALQTLTVMDTKHLEGQPMPETRPTVSVFVNDASSVKPTASVFNFQNPSSEDIQLESPHLTAVFCKQTGLLKELKLKSDSEVGSKMTMSFQAYKSEDFRSGAYLFQANRAEPIVNVTGRFPIIRVVRGPIISEVHTVYPGVISLTSRVYHVDGILGAGLELTTTFDMNVMQDTNLELFMRFETDIESENVFYTDTNGFQIIKRYNMPKLPVEANYYPITSATFIEDAKTRLSLLVSHAHGSTSPKQGAMEVMLDRRLRYDDSRGLGEGVMDNKKTAAQFWLILEQPNSGQNQREKAAREVPNLSLLGHTLSESLNYPPILLVAETGENRPMEKGLAFLEGGLPCDYHLVNLRTLPAKDSFEDPSDNSLLILHRKGVSCHVTSPSVPYGCDAGPENVNKTGPNRVKLGLVRVQNIEKTSLTGLRTIEKLKYLGEVHVDPMNLQSYNVLFAP